jgi:hypothetical protein
MQTKALILALQLASSRYLLNNLVLANKSGDDWKPNKLKIRNGNCMHWGTADDSCVVGFYLPWQLNALLTKVVDLLGTKT